MVKRLQKTEAKDFFSHFSNLRLLRSNNIEGIESSLKPIKVLQMNVSIKYVYFRLFDWILGVISWKLIEFSRNLV